MNHRDHVALIAGGVAAAGPEPVAVGSASVDVRGVAESSAVERAGRRWLELGAGNGEFTLALAECIGVGDIAAVDLDPWALSELETRVAARYPNVRVTAVVADFRHGLPGGPFDGVLAANSLHFVADPVAVLVAARVALAPDGRLVIVEYDADRGNPYVPHPISAARFAGLAAVAGFGVPRLLHRVPSRFLGSIYAAVAEPSPRPA